MDQSADLHGKHALSRESCMMENFNIDEFVPDYDRFHDTWKKSKSVRVPMTPNDIDVNRRLGVRMETMLDWRSLERKASFYEDRYKSASREFWNNLKEFVDEDGKEVIVAVEDPQSESDTVLCVHRSHGGYGEVGYNKETQSRLVSRYMKDSTSANFIFFSYERGGKELGKSLKKETSLYRVYANFRAAFRRAVEDRLRVMVDHLGLSKDGWRFEPASFSLENEGRNYIILLNSSGVFEWCDGRMYRNV